MSPGARLPRRFPGASRCGQRRGGRHPLSRAPRRSTGSTAGPEPPGTAESDPNAVQTNRTDAGNRTLHAERCTQPTQGRGGVNAGHTQRALIGAEAAGRTPAGLPQRSAYTMRNGRASAGSRMPSSGHVPVQRKDGHHHDPRPRVHQYVQPTAHDATAGDALQRFFARFVTEPFWAEEAANRSRPYPRGGFSRPQRDPLTATRSRALAAEYSPGRQYPPAGRRRCTP